MSDKHKQATLREAILSHGVVAPLVLNALMARLAARAGFPAGYVGGGAMGFLNCASEANLSLTQMVQCGLQIRAESSLPLILDGTCGWGDPMHVRHTVRSAEAAGYTAIELEDQVLPKRAHHHVGIEHCIPLELMRAKVEEAVAARRSSDFLIVARTNAARVTNLNDALRRAEAYHRAGADLLMVMPGREGDVRAAAERLPSPLAYMLPVGGVGAVGMSIPDLQALGYRLVLDAATPFFSMFRALSHTYTTLAQQQVDPLVGDQGPVLESEVCNLMDLEALLAIERRTVEL